MNFLLGQSSEFYFIAGTIFLACALLLYLVSAKKEQKQKDAYIRQVDTLKEVCHPYVFLPHQPVVLVACKRCGGHAMVQGGKTRCLNISCEHKTLHT